MHIFLVRHGESIANNGSNYVKRIPDHLVTLSEVGKRQAHEGGIWLANYCKEKTFALIKQEFGAVLIAELVKLLKSLVLLLISLIFGRILP